MESASFTIVIVATLVWGNLHQTDSVLRASESYRVLLAPPDLVVNYLSSDSKRVSRLNTLTDSLRFKRLMARHGRCTSADAASFLARMRSSGRAILVMPFQVGRKWSRIPKSEVVVAEFHYDRETRGVRVICAVNKDGDEVGGQEIYRRLLRYAPKAVAFRFKGTVRDEPSKGMCPPNS
jgi:hypothetical protein